MINKDKNRKKSRLFTRVISLCLTLVMCFSVITPTQVYGASGLTSTIQAGASAMVSIAKSLINMITGGKPVSTSNFVTNGSVNWGQYNGVEVHGYKVSVWFAPINEEKSTDKNPVYNWDVDTSSPDAPFQIGQTIFYRNQAIQTSSGEHISPDFWSSQSVYDQTTLGKDLILTPYTTWGEQHNYAIMNPGVTSADALETFTKMTESYFSKGIELLKLMEEINKKDTEGYLELYDFLSRIYDMNQTKRNKNPETYTYSDIEGLKLSGKPLTPDEYYLPFTTKQKANSGKSIEYIKSYFLNPIILNCISFNTRSEGWDIGHWGVEDYLYGRYDFERDGKYEYPKGQYKIYIEPVLYRKFRGKFGVMSWRDMMLDWKAQDSNNFYGTKWSGNVQTPIVQMPTGVDQAANALALESIDETLKINGVPLGSNGLSDFADATVTAGAKNSIWNAGKNELNTLGLGILTSPSLNSYIPQGPDVVKFYVFIDKVDENGHISFKKIMETTKESVEFSADSFGNIDNVPDICKLDTATYTIPIFEDYDVGYKLYLNDVFTTDEELNISDLSEWTNTDLPTNVGVSLLTSSTDIGGYFFGRIIDRSVDIRPIITDLGYTTINEFNTVANNVFLENFAEGKNENAEMNIYGYRVGTTDILRLEGELGAKEYAYTTDIQLGKITDDGEVAKYTTEELEANKMANAVALPNTLVLRYIGKPIPYQFNYIEVIEEGTGRLVTKFESNSKLVINSDGSVNVRDPEIENLDRIGSPELVEWVTNPEIPIPSISDGVLPNGQKGIDKNIINYPTEPIIHNLFVKWRIIVPKVEPGSGGTSGFGSADSLIATVPEWRLSRYFKAFDDVGEATAGMSLSLNTGCCNVHSLSPTGIWNYKVLNPNGSTTEVKLHSWLHSKTVKPNSSPSVSKGNPSAIVGLSANVTAIKSTDTSNLRAANWIGNSSHSGLLSYDITSSAKGVTFTEDSYKKDISQNLTVKNIDTYTNSYAKYRSRRYGHGHSTRYRYISPESSYVSYFNSPMRTIITFDRYNQVNTDNRLLTVQPDIKSNNGLTTLKYQDSDILNVYPEYGMLFANDEGKESIKWVVGDQSRKIQPIVYQTMQHKVYVKPTSTGNMATDNRARTSLNKVAQGDNTAGNKQVLYKGGPVNTAFQMYRDSGANNKGILTVKTFALDIKTNSNGVNVKNEWGNGNYNAKQSHTSLLNAIDNVGKANVSEKLLVDSPVANSYDKVVDYTGAIKSLTSDKYNRVKYSAGSVGGSLEDNGTVTVFEHELVVRGGQVIGVRLMNRGSGSKSITSISDLKNKDIDLYTALLNMNLYNESNDKSQTVLSTFEHKTGDSLTESNYASMLNTARKVIDSNLETPLNAKVSENEGWYSEDTTVLVVKEYVTNYEVPSISLSDKLSMSVKGLDTPIDKNQFFSVLGKGYTYLKYDLPLTVPNPKGGNFNTNSYFETTSLPNDGLDSFGYQGVDYLVPNVSISDTTRMN